MRKGGQVGSRQWAVGLDETPSEQKESNGILHPGGYCLLFSSSCQLAIANYSRYALCTLRHALIPYTLYLIPYTISFICDYLCKSVAKFLFFSAGLMLLFLARFA